MERLADRYELGDPLGQGRSTVYRAVDTRLRRDVAIKRVQLLAGTEDAEQVRTRALREAQAAARLNDPHVVSVYDVIEESGAIWLVMELVDGPSVARIVDDDGPLTHERAATIGLGVLAALEAAHQVGVVHRDVKPANVLVCDGDRTKLTDFGVATIRDESRVTATGLIVGSPSYMAPEQANAGAITPATDLWALGALLYFAVEGEPPFLEPTPLATATAVVHGEPRVPARPGPLTPLVTRLLTKDPARRPPAPEVRAVLARTARSTAAGPGVAPSPGSPVAPAAPEAPTRSSAEATAVHHGVAPVPPDERGLPAASPARGQDGPGGPGAPGEDATPGATGVSGKAGGPGGRSGAGVPPAPSLDGPERRYRRLLVVGVAAAALALAVTAAALRDDGGGGTARQGTTQTTSPDGQAAPGAGDPGGEGGTTATAPTTADTPTTTEATTTTTRDAGGLPEGWTRFTDPEGTYTIGLPPGWQVRRTGVAYRLDLVDPESGSFLRVEWTDSPKSDVVEDWRAQAESFESRNASYREIDIAPFDYRDYDAALWEFTHTSGGETLHTGNLGLLANGRAYALMFRTPERLWDDSQPLFEQFRQAFQPS
ncbi:MAG TPA: serine/threonine-protein kinase [Acidimicrobiales bacterium]